MGRMGFSMPLQRVDPMKQVLAGSVPHQLSLLGAPMCKTIEITYKIEVWLDSFFNSFCQKVGSKGIGFPSTNKQMALFQERHRMPFRVKPWYSQVSRGLVEWYIGWIPVNPWWMLWDLLENPLVISWANERWEESASRHIAGQIIPRPKTRPISPQKVAFWKGNPLISGKSRLANYYNLARYCFV